MEIIEDRDEFIYKFNKKQIYNFTQISDEIAIEFAPYLDLVTRFLHGSISEHVCREFEDLIQFQIPFYSLIKLRDSREILKEIGYPTVPVIHYEPNSDKITGLSLTVTFPKKTFTIQIYPKNYIRSNREIINSQLSEEVNRREIIGTINLGLMNFD